MEQHSKDVRHFYGLYGDIGRHLIYNVPALGINSPSTGRGAHNDKWVHRRFGGKFDAAPFTADAYLDPDVLPDLAAANPPEGATWATIVAEKTLLAAYPRVEMSAGSINTEDNQPVRTPMGWTPSDINRLFKIPIITQGLLLGAKFEHDNTIAAAGVATAPTQFSDTAGMDGLILVVVIEEISGDWTIQLQRAASAAADAARVAVGAERGLSKGAHSHQYAIATADASRWWGALVKRSSANADDALKGWAFATRTVGTKELV